MSLRIPLPTRHGWVLLLAVLPLCAAGVLTIQATRGRGEGISGEALRQLESLAVGMAVMVAVQVAGYRRLGRLSSLLFAVCVPLLIYLLLDRWVDVPGVTARRNVWRWIGPASVSVQPSELMKIAYVLALAWYLRYRRNYRTVKGLLLPFALTLLPMALIVAQPDLGTVLLFPPVLLAMLLAAGAKVKHLAGVVLLGLACTPLLWFKIATYQRLRLAGVVLQSERTRDWLRERPEVWDRFSGESPPGPGSWRSKLMGWEEGPGYQLAQSKAAVGSGGAFGRGWGRGIFIEYNFLPEKHNDFIFAIIAHQWGLVGSLLVLTCYMIIVVIGFDLATLTYDPFGRLLAVGFSTLLAVQALANLAMTIGLGPVTGVTLPFVSAGGSSLVSCFVILGLLISVHQRRRMLIGHRPFEFDEEAERYGFAMR